MKGVRIVKTACIVLLSLIAFVVLLLAGLQLFVNSEAGAGVIRSLASKYVDAELSWSSQKLSFIRKFPTVELSIDSLSVTYPHDRFASFDDSPVRSFLLKSGRGAEADTLASFSSLTASVNLFKLLDGGIIRLGPVRLEGPRLFLHKYGPGLSNWNVFPVSRQDSVETKSVLPSLSLEGVEICGNPKLFYTAQCDTVFAALGFRSLTASGDFSLNIMEEGLKFRQLSVDIDTLRLFGRLPVDTLGYRMNWLNLRTPDEKTVDLSFESSLLAMSASFGKQLLPFNFRSRFSYEVSDEASELKIDSCKVNLAHFPLYLRGKLQYRDSLYLDVDAGIDKCNVAKVLESYGSLLDDVKGQISTDAILSVNVNAKGWLTKLALPFLKVRAELPDCAFRYELSNLSSSGRIALDADAFIVPQELKTYKFKRSRIKGNLFSSELDVNADSIRATAHHTGIDFNSSSKGILLKMNLDSLSLLSGKTGRVKAKNMGAQACYSKVEHRGQMVPLFSYALESSSLFVRYGREMMGVLGFSADASLRKVQPFKGRRARRQQHMHNAALPEFLTEQDFRKSDVSFSLDSTMVRFFRQWTPAFNIGVDRAFLASPSLPLRTRISALSGHFNGSSFLLDSVAVKCGTSRISAKGSVRGLRPVLVGRRTIFGVDANIQASRLNINELVAAAKLAAKRDSSGHKVISEKSSGYDESFVVDSLDGSGITSSDIKLFVLPANLISNVSVNVDTADFLQLQIHPMSLGLTLKERTLKLSDASLRSNYGSIGLDAFYSTITKQKISAGVDLRMQDMSVGGFLQLLPSMDNMLPALKSFDGLIDAEIAGTARLDTNMNVLMPSLDGLIRINGRDLVISDMSSLRKITRLLRFRNPDRSKVDFLSVDALVSDSGLQIFPFELLVDRYDLALQGEQDFDKTLSYHISVIKSPLLIPFGINISGSLDKTRYSLGRAKFKSRNIPAYSGKIDTVHLNIAKSISDIYRRGAEEVNLYTSGAAAAMKSQLNADTARAVDFPQVPERSDSLILTKLVSEQYIKKETSDSLWTVSK